MAEKRVYAGLDTRPCENCGENVTRKHSAFKDHVFCSRACYHGSEYRRVASTVAEDEKRREVRPCRHCGEDVERFISQFRSDTFCSRACRGSHALTRAQKKVTSHGYVMVFVGVGYPGAPAGSQGQMLEHRKVMQDYLGRPLTADENVHHRNGDRQDNRLENLELWSTSQPRGQRVVDKLAWARSFVARYAETDM